MNDHNLARKLATEAGKILLSVRGKISPLTPGQMPDYDVAELGSRGDKLANEYLLSQLNLLRPDDVVLSEEGIDPSARHGAERVWIIDPLDGTSSFSRGYPGFAVHVALWEAQSTAPSQIAAAAVCVPMISATYSTADRVIFEPAFDSGVHSNLHMQAVDWALSAADGIRIVTSPTNPPDRLSDICTQLSKDFSQEAVIEKRGSVGAKLAHIIAGKADIYVNTSGFNEWDIAAPLAVARHYCLAASLPDGGDFAFNQEDVTVPGAIICRQKYFSSVLKALTDSQ